MAMKAKQILIKLLATALACLFVISGISFSAFAADSSASTSALGEKLSSVNLSIRGKIAIVFYFKNLDNVEYFKVGVPQSDGTTALFNIYKDTLKYDKDNNRYELRVPVAAAQLNDSITVQAFSADGTAGKLRSYSVAQYASSLIELAETNATYASAAETVMAMLNYGAMAQTYFNYKTGELANNGLYYRGTNPINGMTSSNLIGITGAPSPEYGGSTIRFTSVNAYLQDTVSLRFYFRYTGTKYDSPKNLTVQINGETYANEVLRDTNGEYYILINNIPANLFDKQYQVRIIEGDGSYALLNYSVFNYLQAKMSLDGDKDLNNIVYSMFQFYAWTNEYTGVSVIPSDCGHDRTYISARSKNKICSTCGHIPKDTSPSPSFSVDQSGTVTTSEDLSYNVSGVSFSSNSETGFSISRGETMNITGTAITSSSDTNRFHLHYYASAPVKVTMTYSYGNRNQYTASEYYYLEAGENDFSAVEWSFLASKGGGAAQDRVSLYGSNAQRNFKLTSIAVTPLTESADFVLFNYSTEFVSTSSSAFSSANYNGATCKIKYVENSRYKLGINLTWGGAISEWYDKTANDGTIKSTTNLVNVSDAGRLIQQSYYGTNGSNDDYLPRYWRSDASLPYAKWNYNPVQAGDANNNSSRIIDYYYDEEKNYVYIKAQPLDWANHTDNGDGTYTQAASRYTECYVENWYYLSDSYVQVDNRMVDFSGYSHSCTTQELPAFYTLAYFDDYYWYSGSNPWNGALTREDNLPFWGTDVKNTTFRHLESNTETWAAFVNEQTGYGVGLYVPNTDTFKGGRVDGSEANKSASATSGYCSYIAPIKELQIVCYEAIEYSYLLCAGTVDNIRSTFKSNKDFEANGSLDNNSISKKIPDNADLSFIDFSNQNSLLFLDSVNDATVSYDPSFGAIKFVVTGIDSYFTIDYTMLEDVSFVTYNTDDCACIEFEYMIPADSTKYPDVTVGGQKLYYQVGSSLSPSEENAVSEFVALVADGKWHTARLYTSHINGWDGNINSLRVDFLNNGVGNGQVMYLKSFGLSDGSGTSSALVEGQLNAGFYNEELKGQFTDGYWDNVAGNTFYVHNGDYVQVTIGSTFDRYVGFNLGGNKETGKYMIIKYRTDATPSSQRCEVFATVDEHTINSVIEEGKDCAGHAYGWIGDSKWHTLVIDLSTISDNVRDAGSTVKLNQVRIDLFDCFEPGTVIDIAYVGFCEDINATKESLENGEYLNPANSQWCVSVDSVTVNGVAVGKNSTNNEVGANQTAVPVLTGTVLNLTGWFAINGSATQAVEYCVTDQKGVEHWFSVQYSSTGATKYHQAEQGVINHVRNEQKYSNPEDSRRLSINADLLEFVGQTVSVSVRAITADGYAVPIYSVKVNVVAPLHNSLDYVYAGSDLYNEMFGGDYDAVGKLNQANPEVVKNADGTVSVTVTEKTEPDGSKNKWIGIQPELSSPAGKYMVIKYRTSAIPKNGQFYIYASSGANKIKSDQNKMIATGLVGDGRWHTLVIDLSYAPAVSVDPNYEYAISNVRLQMLDQFNAGDVVDFEYIGFCNSLNDIVVKDGEQIEHSWQKWTASIDSVTIDGAPADRNASTDALGANQDVLLNGSAWAWNAGWFAIDGHTVNSLDICVTDKNGVEHWSSVAPGAWWATDEITNHVINSSNFAYSEGTVGYRVNISADLSEYFGQTVSISVVASTGHGCAITVYSAFVSVPRSASPGHLNGSELSGYAREDCYNVKLNSDGTLTLTAKTSGDNYFNNFASLVSGISASKYAVVRYKTTTEASLTVLASTGTNSGGPYTQRTLVNDGEWHVVVFDLQKCENYVVGDPLSFFRINCCDAVGDSITFDYVMFCDSLGAADYETTVNVDSWSVSGTTVQFGGWGAVNGYATTSVAYVVTDAAGNETVVNCAGWNYNRADVTSAVLGRGFISEGTTGFGGSVSANLSAWAGQTVTFSLRATLTNGETVDFYTRSVKVS